MKDGFYKVELNKTVYEVPDRYQDLSPVGAGSFGLVCSARDTITGELVAIKKFCRPFQSGIHAKRTYRELILLRHMDHENVIDLLDVFTPDASVQSFHDVYFVSTFLGTNLCNVLKTQQYTEEHVKFFIYQILRGLKYIHSAGVIHRDLKPSNIAISIDSDLKILDFGLARQTDDEMTGYVITRWYRAPEIIFSWTHYNQIADIWSVGCIMGELFTQSVLFPGDESFFDQLFRIMELVGSPSDDFLSKMSVDAQNYMKSLPPFAKKDFRSHFTTASSDAVDLLQRMLEFDPNKRITAAAALEHPYVAQYHDPTDEPVIEPINLTFEQLDLDVDGWRERMWDFIVDFNSDKSMEVQ